jgi:hypothetical protein
MEMTSGLSLIYGRFSPTHRLLQRPDSNPACNALDLHPEGIWCKARTLCGSSLQRFLTLCFLVSPGEFRGSRAASFQVLTLYYLMSFSRPNLFSDFNDPRIIAVWVTPDMFICKFEMIIIQIIVDTQHSYNMQ